MGGNFSLRCRSGAHIAFVAVVLGLNAFYAPPVFAKKCSHLVKVLANKEVSPEFVAKKLGLMLSKNLQLPKISVLAAELNMTVPALNKVVGEYESLWGFLADFNPEALEKVRKKVFSAYYDICKRRGRTVVLAELAGEIGIPPRVAEDLFGEDFRPIASFTALREESKAIYSKGFDQIQDVFVFNSERSARLLAALENRSRFVVTTAVSGAPVNQAFLESILNYAQKMDADVIVYAANMITNGLDPRLLDHPRIHILTNTIELSPHLALSRIKLIAKQINPLVGLDRIGPRGQSQIVGSPKMHVRTVSTIKNAENPHRLFTSGAITEPVYAGSKYISGRTDEIATHDHMMGALVLEKAIEGDFNIRHIEYIAAKEGFVDLDKFYSASKVTEARAEALVFGDIHVGVTDPEIVKMIQAQIKKFKPKKVILHDLMDALSVNHHDLKNLMTLSERAQKGQLELGKELAQLNEFLNIILKADPDVEIEVVPSNHDFWLVKWLESGQFMREPHNTKIGIELAKAMSDGGNPLEFAIRSGDLLDSKRIHFLEVGDQFKVGSEAREVDLGLHGHQGSNGGKGSLADFRKATDRAVYGHTHTYQRLNGVVNVGTFTQLVLSYNKGGFSNWVQSMAVVGTNSEIQVLEFRNGDFYGDKKINRPDFPEGFPKLIPNAQSDGTGQIDQYSNR